jgi:hypothetical protein
MTRGARCQRVGEPATELHQCVFHEMFIHSDDTCIPSRRGMDSLCLPCKYHSGYPPSVESDSRSRILWFFRDLRLGILHAEPIEQKKCYLEALT